MQKRSLKLINQVSKELGISEDIVLAIVESQFQCARESTKNAEIEDFSTFRNIRFRNLGMITAIKYRADLYNLRLTRFNEKQKQEEQ